MSFDNLCKLLSQKHPDRLAAWILGEPQPLAWLHFKKPLIQQVFGKGMMRESVVYQEIFKKDGKKDDRKRA